MGNKGNSMGSALDRNPLCRPPLSWMGNFATLLVVSQMILALVLVVGADDDLQTSETVYFPQLVDENELKAAYDGKRLRDSKNKVFGKSTPAEEKPSPTSSSSSSAAVTTENAYLKYLTETYYSTNADKTTPAVPDRNVVDGGGRRRRPDAPRPGSVESLSAQADTSVERETVFDLPRGRKVPNDRGSNRQFGTGYSAGHRDTTASGFGAKIASLPYVEPVVYDFGESNSVLSSSSSSSVEDGGQVAQLGQPRQQQYRHQQPVRPSVSPFGSNQQAGRAPTGGNYQQPNRNQYGDIYSAPSNGHRQEQYGQGNFATQQQQQQQYEQSATPQWSPSSLGITNAEGSSEYDQQQSSESQENDAALAARRPQQQQGSYFNQQPEIQQGLPQQVFTDYGQRQPVAKTNNNGYQQQSPSSIPLLPSVGPQRGNLNTAPQPLTPPQQYQRPWQPQPQFNARPAPILPPQPSPLSAPSLETGVGGQLQIHQHHQNGSNFGSSFTSGSQQLSDSGSSEFWPGQYSPDSSETRKLPVPVRGVPAVKPSISLLPAQSGLITEGYFNEDDPIPGEPGRDYPNFNQVPDTSFRCSEQRYPGFYADIDARCQAFHICQSDGRANGFLCPNGTVFNQQYFICDWWYNVECDQSESFYNLNAVLYDESAFFGQVAGKK